MIILAIDLGRARTGIAACDREERLAFPVTTLHERQEERLLESIVSLSAEHRAEALVVGHPRNMDGSYGDSAARAAAFARALEQRTNLPVTLWDERLTTVEATRHLEASGTYGRKRKAAVDAVAAVVILEGYLQSRQ